MRRTLIALGLAGFAGCGSAPVPAAEPAEPSPAVEPTGTAESPAEPPDDDLAARFVSDGRVTLETVAFASGTAELLPESHPELAEVVRAMRDDPELAIVVEVHADSTGRDEFNLRITGQRADAIRDWLVGQGIDGSRIDAVGYGSQRPIAPNSTAEGRARNRRVEIVRR